MCGCQKGENSIALEYSKTKGNSIVQRFITLCFNMGDMIYPAGLTGRRCLGNILFMQIVAYNYKMFFV